MSSKSLYVACLFLLALVESSLAFSLNGRAQLQRTTRLSSADISDNNGDEDISWWDGQPDTTNFYNNNVQQGRSSMKKETPNKAALMSTRGASFSRRGNWWESNAEKKVKQRRSSAASAKRKQSNNMIGNWWELNASKKNRNQQRISAAKRRQSNIVLKKDQNPNDNAWGVSATGPSWENNNNNWQGGEGQPDERDTVEMATGASSFSQRGAWWERNYQRKPSAQTKRVNNNNNNMKGAGLFSRMGQNAWQKSSNQVQQPTTRKQQVRPTGRQAWNNEQVRPSSWEVPKNTRAQEDNVMKNANARPTGRQTWMESNIRPNSWEAPRDYNVMEEDDVVKNANARSTFRAPQRAQPRADYNVMEEDNSVMNENVRMNFRPPQSTPPRTDYNEMEEDDVVMNADARTNFRPQPPQGAPPRTFIDSNQVDDDESSVAKYDSTQKWASFKSCMIGAVLGAWAIAPFTALHHFYFFPTYESTAQWEWDTLTAVFQGGFFAVIYRYLIREDDEIKDMRNVFLAAFVLIRSLVRIRVPMHCTSFPLQCGEPVEFMDWGMIQEFTMNFVESFALFGAVAWVMDGLLRDKTIFRFPR